MKELGLNLIFENHGELTEIFDSSEAFVSDATHKAFIEVNEEGTVAVAVTLRTVFKNIAKSFFLPLYTLTPYRTSPQAHLHPYKLLTAYYYFLHQNLHPLIHDSSFPLTELREYSLSSFSSFTTTVVVFSFISGIDVLDSKLITNGFPLGRNLLASSMPL